MFRFLCFQTQGTLEKLMQWTSNVIPLWYDPLTYIQHCLRSMKLHHMSLPPPGIYHHPQWRTPNPKHCKHNEHNAHVHVYDGPLMKNLMSFIVYSPACCYILELNEALWGGVKFIDGGVDVVDNCAGFTELLRVCYSQKEPVIDLKHLPVNCSKCLKWEMFSHIQTHLSIVSDQCLLP